MLPVSVFAFRFLLHALLTGSIIKPFLPKVPLVMLLSRAPKGDWNSLMGPRTRRWEAQVSYCGKHGSHSALKTGGRPWGSLWASVQSLGMPHKCKTQDPVYLSGKISLAPDIRFSGFWSITVVWGFFGLLLAADIFTFSFCFLGFESWICLKLLVKWCRFETLYISAIFFLISKYISFRHFFLHF